MEKNGKKEVKKRGQKSEKNGKKYVFTKPQNENSGKFKIGSLFYKKLIYKIFL